MMTLKVYAQKLADLHNQYENHEISFKEYQDKADELGNLFLTDLCNS